MDHSLWTRPYACCVTLGKLLPLSGLPFLICKIWGRDLKLQTAKVLSCFHCRGECRVVGVIGGGGVEPWWRDAFSGIPSLSPP